LPLEKLLGGKGHKTSCWGEIWSKETVKKWGGEGGAFFQEKLGGVERVASRGEKVRKKKLRVAKTRRLSCDMFQRGKRFPSVVHKGKGGLSRFYF